MKELSRDEMKKVMGGRFDCGPTCTIAHCYGTYENCDNRSWGNCDGGAGCHEYCVVNGESQYWC